MQPWPTTFAAAVRLHAPVDTSACWFHGFEKRQMQSQEPQDDGGLASLLLFHPALTPGTGEGGPCAQGDSCCQDSGLPAKVAYIVVTATTAPEKCSSASLGSGEALGPSGWKAQGRNSKRPSRCPWSPYLLRCIHQAAPCSSGRQALTGKVPRQAGSSQEEQVMGQGVQLPLGLLPGHAWGQRSS